jgi:hypothetical protein
MNIKKFNTENPNWKGGITLHKVGKKNYKMCIVGEGHHLALIGFYGYLHRVNAEKKLGRKLLPTEIVTFKDKDTLNCDEDNLIIVQNKAELHFLYRKVNSGLKKPHEDNYMTKCKCGCGTEFMKFDKANRPRLYVTGHNGKDYKEYNKKF